MSISETMTEAEATRYWVALLSDDWTIEREVSGIAPDGRRYRMDMLLHPRFDWPSGGRHPIGLELKRPSKHVSTFVRALAQANEYSTAKWFSDYIPGVELSVYVAIVDSYTSEMSLETKMLAERMAGHQNVGLLRRDSYRGRGKDWRTEYPNLTLYITGHRRWSLARGPLRSNIGPGPFNAIPKRGSR